MRLLRQIMRLRNRCNKKEMTFLLLRTRKIEKTTGGGLAWSAEAGQVPTRHRMSDCRGSVTIRSNLADKLNLQRPKDWQCVAQEVERGGGGDFFFEGTS